MSKFMALFIFCLEVVTIGISLCSNFLTSYSHCQLGWDHTLCRYPTGSGCPKIATGLNSTVIQDILRAHNQYRQKIALGQEIGQPSASNMKEMIWDEELATVAQRWADQCIFGHDVNRKTSRFPDWVGQNIAFNSEWSASDETPDFNGTAIPMWYDEVTSFNSEHIDPFQYSGNTAHYTQMVWAETFAIGCGYAFYRKDDIFFKHYVCNYAPGGNVIEHTMYQKGDVCSKCGDAFCSATYPGLCESTFTN